jgi:hypothetical protein
MRVTHRQPRRADHPRRRPCPPFQAHVCQRGAAACAISWAARLMPSLSHRRSHRRERAQPSAHHLREHSDVQTAHPHAGCRFDRSRRMRKPGRKRRRAAEPPARVARRSCRVWRQHDGRRQLRRPISRSPDEEARRSGGPLRFHGPDVCAVEPLTPPRSSPRAPARRPSGAAESPPPPSPRRRPRGSGRPRAAARGRSGPAPRRWRSSPPSRR